MEKKPSKSAQKSRLPVTNISFLLRHLGYLYYYYNIKDYQVNQVNEGCPWWSSGKLRWKRIFI